MVSEAWMIIATIVSPAIAVQVTRYLDQKKEKRGRKLDVFKTLMATRANTILASHVESLNRIDIEFAADDQAEKNVVRRWREYLDLLGNKSIPIEQWSIKRVDLLVDLLYEMGVALGYDFDKVQIRNGTYAPVAHSKIEEESQLIRENLIKILEGSRSISVALLEAEKSQVLVQIKLRKLKDIMRIVRIVQKKTGEMIAEIPIVLQGVNYTPSQEEVSNESWKTAIEDGLVDKEKRADFEFKVSKK